MDPIEKLIVEALQGKLKRGESERVIAWALARTIRTALEEEVVGNLTQSLHEFLFPTLEEAPWNPDD